MKDFKPLLAFLLLGLAIMASAWIFGTYYYSAQAALSTKDTLAVTGSTKTRVTSDQAKLVVAFQRTVPVSELSQGYSSLAHDIKLTRDLLKQEGVDESGITESPATMFQNYDQSQTNPEQRFNLNQTVTVQSHDVSKITSLSKKIPDLTAQGAIVSVQSLEYYYSGLPDLRVSLLEDAVKDARARAEKIAAGTGRRIGSVQSASSGVVQVLTPDSVDISDYGSYDTSSIDKDVMVTTKVSFRLE